MNRIEEIARRKREQKRLPPLADPEGLGVGLKRCLDCNRIQLWEEPDRCGCK